MGAEISTLHLQIRGRFVMGFAVDRCRNHPVGMEMMGTGPEPTHLGDGGSGCLTVESPLGFSIGQEFMTTGAAITPLGQENGLWFLMSFHANLRTAFHGRADRRRRNFGDSGDMHHPEPGLHGRIGRHRRNRKRTGQQ